MRLKFSLLLILTVACPALLAIGCASSGQGRAQRFESDSWWHESQAVIRDVRGNAQISRDGQGWGDARPGMKLDQGAQIRTGPDSTLELDFGEKGGGVMTVTPGSLVILEQLGPESPNAEVMAVINLPMGRVTGDTLKLPQNKKIIVKTPSGTYEVR